MATAERALEINRALGRDQSVAVGLGQIAHILMMQQRYAEAEERYDEALRAAQAAGDLELQGVALQHQGGLQYNLGHYDQAVERYREALRLHQRAGNQGSEMMACNNLGEAESQRGQLDAAEAWFRRSRALAEQLGDQKHLAGVAQNLGILYQTRAEQTADPEQRTALLRQAVVSVAESLASWLEQQNQVDAAGSYTNLSKFYWLLGDLDAAEQNAQQALQTFESLDLPEVYKVYWILADIARDRSDAQAAERWQAKRDAKLAELEKRRRGNRSDEADVPKEVVQAILALAQAAYTARDSQTALPPDVAEVLAQLDAAPDPFPALATFLRTIAKGEPVPNIPPGLPESLRAICAELVKAV